MKGRDNNRLRMIDTTIAFCDGNTTATGGITAFATTLASVKAKRLLINGLNQVARGSTKGVTLDTKGLRKVMTEIAVKCANATSAYATATSNNTLLALVDYNESKLNAIPMDEVADVCEGIHDAADANIAGASGYGITATDVTDLQTAIGLYRMAVPNSRGAIISKSQANKQAKAMIKDIIVNWFEKLMDKMVNTLKVSNNDFWKAYFQSREVVDLGTNTAKVRGTVKDENDVPLRNADFTIMETGTQTLVKKAESDIKGKFDADHLPAGNVDFLWEKEGYISVSETNFHIAAGKDYQRRVVMVAGGGSAVYEGNVAVGAGIVNVDITGITVIAQTTIEVVITGGPLRAFAGSSADALPGALFLDLAVGTFAKSMPEFIAMLGFSNTNKFFNFQNNGVGQGHYKVTFRNLGVK